MHRSGALTRNTWIADAFLFFFGVWLALKGTGLTDRYAVISDNEIVLKDKFYAPAMIIRASDITKAGFGQLKITLFLRTGKIIPLRLGTFYRESSLELMETAEAFCNANGIPTSGIITDEERSGNEA